MLKGQARSDGVVVTAQPGGETLAVESRSELSRPPWRRGFSDIDHHRTVLLADGVEGDRLALGAPAVGEGESACVERTHDGRRVELPVGERAAGMGAAGLGGAQGAVAQAEHGHLLSTDRVRAPFPGRDGVDRAQPVRGTPLRRRHAIAPVGFVPAGDDDPSRTGT